MFQKKMRKDNNGRYSFLKSVQVQMLNLCDCNIKKGQQNDSNMLDPILTTPFFDAIR